MGPRHLTHFALAALCACAHSPTETARQPTKESVVMAASDTSPADNPIFNAEEIGKRVLALIQNIHDNRDISPETIEKYIGLKVRINPDNENDYGVSGKLTDQWYYSLRSMSPEKPGQKPNSLLFDFNDQTHAGADMSPVCVGFEDYNLALTTAGFTATRLRNRVDTQDYWNFSRGSIGVKVYLRGKSNPKDAQTCISMLIISAHL